MAEIIKKSNTVEPAPQPDQKNDAPILGALTIELLEDLFEEQTEGPGYYLPR